MDRFRYLRRIVLRDGCQGFVPINAAFANELTGFWVNLPVISGLKNVAWKRGEGGIGGSISLDVFLADGPTSRRLVTSQFTKLPEDRLIRSTYLRLARVELRGAMVPVMVGRSRKPKSW